MDLHILCAGVSVCLVCSAGEGKVRTLDPLELAVVSCHMGAGNPTEVL